MTKNILPANMSFSGVFRLGFHAYPICSKVSNGLLIASATERFGIAFSRHYVLLNESELALAQMGRLIRVLSLLEQIPQPPRRLTVRSVDWCCVAPCFKNTFLYIQYTV